MLFFEHVVNFDKLHTALQIFYNIKRSKQNDYLNLWSEGSGSPQIFINSGYYSRIYFLLNVMVSTVVVAP